MTPAYRRAAFERRGRGDDARGGLEWRWRDRFSRCASHSPSLLRPLNTTSATFCDAEFVKVHTIYPFPPILCLLIITDVDDAGQVITPTQPRIGVSNSLSITYVYCMDRNRKYHESS